jgi:hypothetical protein
MSLILMLISISGLSGVEGTDGVLELSDGDLQQVQHGCEAVPLLLEYCTQISTLFIYEIRNRGAGPILWDT